MKTLITFISTIFCITNYAQNASFPYEKEWGTYLNYNIGNGYGSSYYYVKNTYDTQGNLYYKLSTSILPTPLQPYLVSPVPAGHFYLIKYKNTGELEYITKQGGIPENSVNNPMRGELEGDIVAGGQHLYSAGVTNRTQGIGTAGTYKPLYSYNIFPGYSITTPDEVLEISPGIYLDGYLIKLDLQGNKIWGTYINGNREVQAINVFYKNNFLYVYGITNSYQDFATPGSFCSTVSSTEIIEDMSLSKTVGFIARINPDNGQLLWCSYIQDSNINHVENTSEIKTIDTDNEGYVYFATSKISNKVIYKVSPDGSAIVGEYQIPNIKSIEKIHVGTKNNVHIIAITEDEEGVATPGTYSTVKSYPLEFCLLKYNREMTKIWGTYLKNYIINFNSAPKKTNMFIDNDENCYFGTNTDVNGLASENTYQSNIAGGGDIIIKKISSTGEFKGGTYFGGDKHELLPTFFIDTAENIYLTGITGSTQNISTPNGQFPIANVISNNFIDHFSAKLTKIVPTSTKKLQKPKCTIYPNPAKDMVTIESAVPFTENSLFKIYDTNGKLILEKNGYESNLNTIKLEGLPTGSYLIEIEDNKHKSIEKLIIKN